MTVANQTNHAYGMIIIGGSPGGCSVTSNPGITMLYMGAVGLLLAFFSERGGTANAICDRVSRRHHYLYLTVFTSDASESGAE